MLGYALPVKTKDWVEVFNNLPNELQDLVYVFIQELPGDEAEHARQAVELKGHDPTENARRALVDRIEAANTEARARDPNATDSRDFAPPSGVRERLEATYGRVWDTDEMQRDFTVEGFGAPFVVVRRKADGARGTLAFQHSPRFYFAFQVRSTSTHLKADKQ